MLSDGSWAPSQVGSTLDAASVDYSALASHNLGAFASRALGEDGPSLQDSFPFRWTAEEMGRIVRALVRRSRASAGGC